jgi:hypothetical protein
MKNDIHQTIQSSVRSDINAHMPPLRGLGFCGWWFLQRFRSYGAWSIVARQVLDCARCRATFVRVRNPQHFSSKRPSQLQWILRHAGRPLFPT